MALHELAIAHGLPDKKEPMRWIPWFYNPTLAAWLHGVCLPK